MDEEYPPEWLERRTVVIANPEVFNAAQNAQAGARGRLIWNVPDEDDSHGRDSVADE